MNKAEEYLIDRMIVLGCVRGSELLDELSVVQEVDNPFKKGESAQRFSKIELFEVS